MRIPSLRQHATGQAFFTVSGRNFYCGPWGHKTSKAKYKRLVAELLTEDCPDNFAIPKNQLEQNSGRCSRCFLKFVSSVENVA